MKVSVTKEFSFAYAHRLPNHPGKCRRLHGHTGLAQVTVTGPVDPETGMVIDFGDLETMWKELLKDTLDHSYLNDIRPQLETPTAENLASFIFDVCSIAINRGERRVSSVRVYETPTNFAEFSIED